MYNTDFAPTENHDTPIHLGFPISLHKKRNNSIQVCYIMLNKNEEILVCFQAYNFKCILLNVDVSQPTTLLID